jgi:hypothetical protein
MNDHPSRPVADTPVIRCEWCRTRIADLVCEHFNDLHWTCAQCAPVPVAQIPEPSRGRPPVARGPGALVELVATAVLVTGVGFTVGHLFAWAQRVLG